MFYSIYADIFFFSRCALHLFSSKYLIQPHRRIESVLRNHPRRSQAALKFDEKVFRILHDGKPVVEVTIDPLSTVRVQVEQTEANKRNDNDRGKTITIVQDEVYKYCLNVDYVNDLPSIEFEAYWVETRQFSATVFVR